MIIDIKKLTKTFIDGDRKLNVLKDINLQIEKGSIVTIKGPSGSGKSTLLSIIGTLDSADSGDILINGKNRENFADRWKDKLPVKINKKLRKGEKLKIDLHHSSFPYTNSNNS